MPERSNLSRDSKSRLWLYGEPAVRSIQRLSKPVKHDFAHIIDNGRREISERTRRVLTYSNDSLNKHSTPVHIITKREFEFGDIDNGLIQIIKNVPKESE